MSCTVRSILGTLVTAISKNIRNTLDRKSYSTRSFCGIKLNNNSEASKIYENV